MHKENKSTLMGYSALAVAFLSAGKEADAQIIYTDIDPDTIIAVDAAFYELDLNADGTPDFTLTKRFLASYNPTIYTTYGGVFAGSIQLNHIYGTAQGSNALLGEVSPYGFQYPFAMDLDDEICDGGAWLNGNYQSLAYSYGYKLIIGTGLYSYVQLSGDGNWFGGQTDKYLGLKLQDEGNTYYGWLRMDVAADNIAFAIKDYAFQSIADSCIRAGQLVDDTVVVESVADFPETFNVYSFGNTIAWQDRSGNWSNGTLMVYNINGQLVIEHMMSGAANGKLELPFIASGIYQLVYKNEDRIFTRKLFLEPSQQ